MSDLLHRRGTPADRAAVKALRASIAADPLTPRKPWHRRQLERLSLLLFGSPGMSGPDMSAAASEYFSRQYPSVSAYDRRYRSASCPAWCEANHNELDPKDMEAHAGEVAEIELQADPATSRYQGALDVPVTVIAQMVTNPDSNGTVIQLDHDSIRTWVELSMDDAEELGLFLLRMVQADRATARAMCEHDFPLVMTGSAAKPGNCRKCGKPRYA